MTTEELNLVLQTYLAAQAALFSILDRRGQSLEEAIAASDAASQEFHAKNQARIKALEARLAGETKPAE